MPQLINMLKAVRSGEDYFEASHNIDGLEKFASCGKVLQDAKLMGLVTYTREIHTVDKKYLTAIEGVALTIAGRTFLRSHG